MRMDILIAGDRSVLPGIEILVYSTMFHNPNVNIFWHILSMDIEVDNLCGTVKCYRGLTTNDVAWLKKIVKFFDYKSEVVSYDVKDYYNKYLSHSVNFDTGFTPFAALRLLADLILPIDSCLYLDADVLVQKNISRMYEEYLQKDHFNYAAYTLPDACNGYGEMISAVIFFNLKHIRRTGFLEQARRMYNKNQYVFPDQMALRDAGDPEPLDETYNYMQDYREATYHPAILHFSNHNVSKIYSPGVLEGYWWKHNPAFQYIKDGLDLIKTIH